MKDFLGNELNVGDTIVLNKLYGNSYKKYKMISVKITRMTDKMVFYAGIGYNNEKVEGKMQGNKVVWTIAQ